MVVLARVGGIGGGALRFRGMVSFRALIVQKQQAQKFAQETTVRDLSRPDATDRDTSRQKLDDLSTRDEPAVTVPQADPHQPRHDTGGGDTERQGATAASGTRDQTIEKLRREISDLKIDNAGKQNFIRQMDGSINQGKVRWLEHFPGTVRD